LESHGGYLCRLETLDAGALCRMARRALPLDGVVDRGEVSLLISALRQRKVVRLAFDASFTYGRRGARWYERHHALARLASRELGTPMHAYVLDVDELEQVQSYGNGQPVGGERLLVADAELPDEDHDFDDDAFEKMKQRWPLGHLARVYGVTRDELVRLPRSARSVLIDLDAPRPGDLEAAESLLPYPGVRRTG
jgi:hypothetical protein